MSKLQTHVPSYLMTAACLTAACAWVSALAISLARFLVPGGNKTNPNAAA